MKIWCTLSLMAVAFLSLTSARKNRKKGAAPVWKPSSMPAQNKRFETEPEGKSLKFDCKAHGQPKPNVQWFKDGVRIRNKNSPKMETRKFGLNLNDVTVDMSGNYTCLVKNKHGQLEWTIILEVQTRVWPMIVDGPRNLTQTAGSDVVFTCRVLNDPAATIRWQRIFADPPYDDFLPDGDDSQMLKLKNVKKEDEGEYRCMAGNINGLKYSSAWLHVIEPAVLPNQPTPNGDLNNWSFGNNNPDIMNPVTRDPFDFGSDRFYTTTKRPRKNGSRKNSDKRKKKKKKNRKNKPIITEPPTTSPTTVSTTLFPTDSSTIFDLEFEPTTPPVIWRYNNEPTDEGVPDTRYNPNLNGDFNFNNRDGKSFDETGKEGNLGSAKSDNEENVEGNISAWKIYTIVGAVGGVILLIGLVAITIAICCPKQEGGVYKSTPV